MGLVTTTLVSLYAIGYFAINPSMMMSEKHAIENLHLNWLDTNIAPKDNFYLYANGGWLKNTSIPPDTCCVNYLSLLRNNVHYKTHKIILELLNSKKEKLSNNEKKIVDFYLSGMDEKTINNLGVAPLQLELSQIDSIQNIGDVVSIIAKLHLIGVNSFFSISSITKNDNIVGSISNGQLTVKGDEYYVNEDEHAKNVRTEMLRYMIGVFELLGESRNQASKSASVVMNIERILVKANFTNDSKNDGRMTTVRELDRLSPYFSWESYFSSMGLSDIKSVNVKQASIIKTMNYLLKTFSIDDIKTYLKWTILDKYSQFLSNDYLYNRFHLRAALYGFKKYIPRWHMVIFQADDALGDAIGEMYVKKYNSFISTLKIISIFHQIKKILRREIQLSSSMTIKEKDDAIKKLDSMTAQISHPNKTMDYSALEIKKDTYLLNNKNANNFIVKKKIEKIGKKSSDYYWHTFPQITNSFYDGTENTIIIPIAVFQPLFEQSSDAIIYGTIGVSIGHEITHAFYNETHNASVCIANQFSKYHINKTLKVNGSLVEGEAKADLGGVRLAYRAFRESNGYKNTQKINGFTPDQQFFLSFAHSNIAKFTMNANYDVWLDSHPPANYRVNGTLANLPEFQKAFDIPDDSPMVNKNRCVVW